jgi:CubicO group peptidase (beta-lactamase class C family)
MEEVKLDMRDMKRITMRRNRRRRSAGAPWVVAFSAALLACGEAPTAPRPVVDLSAEWSVSPPEAESLDPQKLDAAAAHAETLPRVLSLLVVRHGHLVFERYLHGNTRDSLNDVRSVTKSIVSSLAGIAVDRGAFPGVNATIAPYLTAEQLALLDAPKRAITIGNLLTMSSGFLWDESIVAGYNAWVGSPDPVAYVLTKPLVTVPGRAFSYNSATVHLLSRLTAQATGIPLEQFAQQYLFDPLGVTRVRWEYFPDGHPNGGSGIAMRPRDLAKVGALWLQRGDGGSRQIISRGWIAAATSPNFNFWNGGAPLAEQSYGYLWWLDRQGGYVHFSARGFGGQVIWVATELDLVVVVTTEWRNAGGQAALHAAEALELIVNYVLPAVR